MVLALIQKFLEKSYRITRIKSKNYNLSSSSFFTTLLLFMVTFHVYAFDPHVVRSRSNLIIGIIQVIHSLCNFKRDSFLLPLSCNTFELLSPQNLISSPQWTISLFCRICRMDALSAETRFSSLWIFSWIGFLEMAPMLVLGLFDSGAVANGKSSICFSRFDCCLCSVADALFAFLAALSNCTKCHVQKIP